MGSGFTIFFTSFEPEVWIHTGPSWSDERFGAHSSQILNLSTCDSDLIFALLRAQTRRGGTGGTWRAWCPSCCSACSAWRSRPRAPRCSSRPAGPSPTPRVRLARRSTPGAPDVHAELRFALSCTASSKVAILIALTSCIGKRSLDQLIPYRKTCKCTNKHTHVGFGSVDSLPENI